MTLNCSANNCIYNKSGVCYAGNIQIIGEKATTTSNTSCSTFQEKDNNNFTSCSSNNFTTSSDILCKAKKCNYNSDEICTADSVQINYNNASCDTFICQ